MMSLEDRNRFLEFAASVALEAFESNDPLLRANAIPALRTALIRGWPGYTPPVSVVTPATEWQASSGYVDSRSGKEITIYTKWVDEKTARGRYEYWSTTLFAKTVHAKITLRRREITEPEIVSEVDL